MNDSYDRISTSKLLSSLASAGPAEVIVALTDHARKLESMALGYLRHTERSWADFPNKQKDPYDICRIAFAALRQILWGTEPPHFDRYAEERRQIEQIEAKINEIKRHAQWALLEIQREFPVPDRIPPAEDGGVSQ